MSGDAKIRIDKVKNLEASSDEKEECDPRRRLHDTGFCEGSSELVTSD